jgi:hypothetical protein
MQPILHVKLCWGGNEILLSLGAATCASYDKIRVGDAPSLLYRTLARILPGAEATYAYASSDLDG